MWPCISISCCRVLVSSAVKWVQSSLSGRFVLRSKQADICEALGTNLGRRQALRFYTQELSNLMVVRTVKTESTELWLSANPGRYTQGLWEHREGEPHFHGVVREKSELGTFKVGFAQ